MARRALALAAMVAAASANVGIARCGPRSDPSAAETPPMSTNPADKKLRGYDIQLTGLVPAYPKDFDCSPLTSLYASWVDVDGSMRDEAHSGIDGGRLGEPILAPAPGTVRRVWVANWGQGPEGAVLLAHSREQLNLTEGAQVYYTELDHLKYDDVKGLTAGRKITRGERIANVFRPGGKGFFLPEVHFETWEVGDDKALTWVTNDYGTERFENPTARLIDPLWLLSREVRPNERLEVPIQPFESQRDYSKFKGFTYFLPCSKRGG